MGKKALLRIGKSRGKISLWLLLSGILLTQLLGSAQAVTDPGQANPQANPSNGPLVQLQSASGLSIEFQTENGQNSSRKVSETKKIPHLVLFRNGGLTSAEERTLQITLAGLKASPGSELALRLKVETQHGDPDQGGNEGSRIVVWEHSQCIPLEKDGYSSGLTLEKEFAETVDWQGERVTTPSDYFRVELSVYESTDEDAEPVFTFSGDYAFLMESQSVVNLEGVKELSPGAAPDELVVYYADMFPFQGNPDEPETRLPRAGVHTYIHEELSPALLEAVRMQTGEWGFAWHEAWTGFTKGSTGDRLEVALVNGSEWFHGKAPIHAHGGISINLDWANRRAYNSLTDWIVSVFHHELFHNLQRNQNLMHGGDGDVDGKQEAWEFLAEGTAVLAASAGHPDVEFASSVEARSYPSRANRFLAGTEFFESELNASYKEINPYSSSVYWRFLYEQCSGPGGAQGDLETGMQVIRQTLNSLYASDNLVGISREELVEAIPGLMNRVFSKTNWCPFRTYQESLVAFSRAVYTLRLEGGRCERAVGLAGCGFYDPNGIYPVPQVEEIPFLGEETDFHSGIAGSYGMAFVEIILDPGVQGRSLELSFEPAEGGAAEFSVQVWKLKGDENERLVSVPTPENSPAVLVSDLERRRAFYPIERIDRGSYDRLGLVITRLDSRESQDPVGAFTISLRPAAKVLQGKGD